MENKAITSKLDFLIIDDNELDREKSIRCLRKGFKSLNLNFHEVDTIKDGYSLIEKIDIDCIILDHNLPDGMSTDFINLLKINKYEIPIIVITGYGNEKIVLDVLKMGALDYISKDDINENSLIRAVIGSIKSHKAILEKRQYENDLVSFASSVAHDLKTPLNGIISSVEVLNDDEGNILTSESKEFLGIIMKSANNMNRLIIDLLEFATIKDKKEKFEMIDLNEVFIDNLEALKQSAERANAQIIIEENFPSLNGYKVKISQLFQNIIANSIKYRSDSRSLKIEISYKLLETNSIEIKFSDNGIGFEQKYAAEIFKPLKRLHSDEIEGSGIGLATCKSIIDLHSGSIRAESQPNVGTKIFVVLPMK